MDDFLTDQQQAARVRSWVRQYAPSAAVALAIGIGGYFGYDQWQARGEQQTAEASERFEELRDILDSSNRDGAEELHQRLLADFPESAYADHARLLMAKEYVDTTRPAMAAEELRELIAGTADSDLRQLARLRLARVYLYMDRPQDGLEVLEAGTPSDSWQPLTEDARGDLHRALGQVEKARTAYQAALDRTGQADFGWIRMKLDDLAGQAGAQDAADEEAAGGEDQRPAAAEQGNAVDAAAELE